MYLDGWFPILSGCVLLCLLLIGFCILLVGHAPGTKYSLHTLDQRFARGELGDAEYKAEREAILLL
jgi:uncharacterized membrane protein